MTQALIDNLPLIAAAPDGIKALRGLILDLAVRGKLVPQDPEDEPASELLKQIAAEKKDQPHNRRGRGRNLESDPLNDVLGLPSGWHWSSMGDVSLLVTDGTHFTPNYIADGVPFLSIKDISGGRIDFSDTKFISIDEHLELNARCNPERNDILLCRIGTLGRPVIVETDVPFSLFVSVGLIKMPKTVDVSRWAKLALDSPFMHLQYEEIKAGGSHTNKLNLGDIPRLRVPLPPLAEQRRIVAKVDELMALCDRLEAQQADAEAVHAALVQTLLHTLTQSQDADDFAANWQRLSQHFPTIFITEASVDALKQAVIELALAGRIVRQIPDDESVSDLIRRVQLEKTQGQAVRKARSPKLASIDASEQNEPQLPSGWAWVCLGEVVLNSEAGWSPNCESRPRAGEEWGVLKVSAVSWGQFRPLENKALPSNLRPRPEYEVLEGDLLVSRANTSELVARSVIVEECPPKLMLSDKIIRLRLSKHVNPKYINTANLSPIARRYYASVAGGTSSSMKNVSREQILNLRVPLPPLAEQHRIVAKVDELFALCDSLKAQIAESRAVQRQLATALVEQAVAA